MGSAPHNTAAIPPPKVGSGTATVASELENLFAFQTLKSDASTTPSAVKSPRHQAAAVVNLWEFHRLKSDVSTTPSRLASPVRYGFPEVEVGGSGSRQPRGKVLSINVAVTGHVECQVVTTVSNLRD